jgi:hypothetical protein
MRLCFGGGNLEVRLSLNYRLAHGTLGAISYVLIRLAAETADAIKNPVKSMRNALIRAALMGLVAFSGVIGSPGQIQYVRTTNFFPVADSTIRNTLPGVNFGSATNVMAGYGGAGPALRRGLFRFDLSSIPANATVSNVTFNVVGISSYAHDYFILSRLLTNWDEAGVTWNNRTTTMPWSVPGGQSGVDFFGSFSSYALLSAPGITNQFTDDALDQDAGLVYDVQLWITNPAQNFGWILTGLNENSNGTFIAVGSRENPFYPPVLTVGYTQPFTPPVLQAVPSTNGEFCFSFNVEPYHSYQIQSCGDPTWTNWTTVLILDPPLVPTNDVFCYPMTGGSLFYRVSYQ